MGSFPPGQHTGAEQPKNFSRIWYLDKNNALAMAMVKTGVTDGKSIEIVKSRELEPGMQVIVGNQQSSSENQSSSSQKSFRPPGPF